MTEFVLSSPDIPTGGTIPQIFEFNSFGCTGRNESPTLCWSGTPGERGAGFVQLVEHILQK
jgi:phosphatidylethanolamine-binding protein (PEBP) family uncharacterized protein